MVTCLKGNRDETCLFNLTYTEINNSQFGKQDQSTFYRDIKEIIMDNAPQARGKNFIMVAFVDVDYAGDPITRRSRTGLFIYLKTPQFIGVLENRITWKRAPLVPSSQ